MKKTEKKIDQIIEDAVASSAIEGYHTSEREKRQLKDWYLKGFSDEEIIAKIKKDMGLINE